MIVCGDIGNRRETVHWEDQAVINIMDWLEFLRANHADRKDIRINSILGEV